MSHASAIAAGLSTQSAPFRRCAAARSRRTSWTRSAWPSFWTPAWRLAAMLAPMVPRPMKPAFIVLFPYGFASKTSRAICAADIDAGQPA